MGTSIADTYETFDTWLQRDYITDELRGTLSAATILIVPYENLREGTKPLFPTDTEEIMRFFKEKLPSSSSIDICIEDEEYQEFSFNNDYKWLGKFVVKDIALVLFLNIFSSYVSERYFKEDDRKPQIVVDQSTHLTVNNGTNLTEKEFLAPSHIKFSVTIVDSTGGGSKQIDFEGGAEEFKKALNALKEYEK